MPTGYTADLMEKGMEFKPFVLQCARAFGALITMRDDSLDAPSPKSLNRMIIILRNWQRQSRNKKDYSL